MKTRFNLRLTAAVSAVIMLSGMSSVSAADLSSVNAGGRQLAESQPTEALLQNRATDTIYIVRLADPAIAVYDGGIAGYQATSAKATGKKRLDTNSKAAKKYQKHLERKQKEVLDQAASAFGHNLTTKYDYQHAINGFAVSLTAAEAKAMGNMAGVVSVQRERMEHLLTDSGPAWIGAPDLWSNGGNSTQGEGMVVAVLDTGINSDHPSFADIGGDGYNHSNPLGSGNYLPGSHCDAVDPSFCNDKLIGAWDMTDASDGITPEDTDGHGSHTASTAAGNVVIGATLDAPTTSISFDVSGVAPHANIIAYDVCTVGCPGAALVAAINQVVIDAGNLPNGIASLNYSISGGGNPYNDTVELGFLAAVQAGIYVAASAGNSGPAASTVAHLGPWVSTTAASTHNRQVRNSINNLNSDGGSTPDITGLGFTSGYGPALIVNSADYEGHPGLDPAAVANDATLCGMPPSGASPFPAGFFTNGEIVACTRGAYGRVQKGMNVLTGGAGGYVLMDNGGGLVGDAHVLPGVHISQADGAILGPWLTANAANNPMATIAGFSVDLSDSNGDVMAGFSSRGPQLAFDVLKPDVTAPGVDIFAAEADGGTTANPNQFLSGTSMSSPHNAGAGALMAAAQPNWTPQEIKSALMLTATTENTVKEDGVTPTDPFDLGAGRLSLGDAENAGLVMDESIGNFLAADPSSGGDPSTLNLASMMDSNCVGTCSWTRTVTNKTKQTNHWNVTVSGVGFDTEVTVSPQANGANNLKLKKGQSATITVTASNYSSADGWQFGTLNLASNGNSGPDLHMPMAVFASKTSNADLFNKSVDSDTAVDGDTLTYEIAVTNGLVAGPITVNDAVPAGSTFVAGSETESVANGTTTSPWTYDGGSNSLSWTGELDVGGLDISPGAVFGPPFFPLGVAPLALTCNGDCDDGGYFFNVPPYTFNGETYTQTLFSVNGTLEAGSASGGFSSFANQNLPDASLPNNILAPFWRDLNLNDGGSMSIAVFGVCGGSVTAYEWLGVPHFGSPGEVVNMQAWVFNNDSCLPGVITFQYGDMSTGISNGGTIGVENSTGTLGDTYFFNGAGTAPVLDQELIISTLQGGSATLGFQVTTDCSEELVINEATLSNTGANENAIAVTTCQ